MTKVVFNPNPPAPVCIIYDTHNGPHWEGPGVFHLYKKNVCQKTVKPPVPPSVQHSTVHSTYSAQQNYFKI